MEPIPGLPPELARRAEAAAAWIDERKQAGDKVIVAHHIDADGLAAGAVAMECLTRAGVEAEALAARSLDDVHLARIGRAVGTVADDGAQTSPDAGPSPAPSDALWFCDFGSTAYMHFPDVPRLVCDHHELVRDGTEEDFAHLNPLLDGIPGDTVSGAGCAFLAAYAHDAANVDLVPLALVGATGDLQDRGKRDGTAAGPGFQGANAALLDLGEAVGLLDAEEDLAWFGPETRPLRKFLAFGSEPAVPGITNDMRGAEAFLVRLGVPLTGDAGERAWSALDDDERTRVRSGLVHRLVDCGLAERVQALWRPVVRITGEAPGRPTRELQEFGTLLNSTARYDEPDVGLTVARGERGEVFQKALGLRDGHRQNLVRSLDAFRQVGIQEAAAVQWVHLEDRVRDTVVGIVCGMALDGLGLRRDRPLVGFAYTPEGDVKVSSRAPHEIKGRIDLATAMREAAAAVGGQGGGHKGAAGASIPRGKEPAFLDVVEGIVAGQLGLQPATTGRPAADAADGQRQTESSPAATATTGPEQGTLTTHARAESDAAAQPASGAEGAAQTRPTAATWRGRPGQNKLF